MGAEYLPLIGSLMKLDAPIVLFGGFAEDAMLNGTIRRHHDDVDFLIERSSLPRGLEIFDELGFGPPEVRWAPVAGEPLVMGTIRDELNLELSVKEFRTDLGVEPTGTVDAATLAALEETLITIGTPTATPTSSSAPTSPASPS